MIWVYVICERPEVPLPVSTLGLAGAPLEGLREGQLLAALSRHAELGEISTLEALSAHERVVEQLMDERTVLPMRFGSQLAGDAALRSALASHHDELIAALDRVRGKVELAVRVIRADSVPGGDVPACARPGIAASASAAEGHPSGREYVRAKLERRERDEVAGTALHGPLATLAVAARRHLGLLPGELLHAAYLVERPTVGEFRDAARRLQRERRDVAVLCTGPWPPYSFVDVDVGSEPTVGIGA